MVKTVGDFLKARGMMKEPKKWMGSRPSHCEMGGEEFKNGDQFIDGRTRRGYWAIMCIECFEEHGTGLGTGSGQRYDWESLEKLFG